MRLRRPSKEKSTQKLDCVCMSRRGEFSYEAMETLLTTMVHEDKLIVTAGHYSLHPDNRILHSDSSADEFAEG